MQKIVVAVTGASGSIYAKILLERLAALHSQIEAAVLVVSEKGEEVCQFELGEKLKCPSIFKQYNPGDFFSPVASGSAGYTTMIVCPCSMGTLGRIAGGFSNDLITRAADVILKERARLILVPRETPFSLIHLNNMKSITEAGGIICPASPSFYSKPQSIDDLANTIVDRVLSLAGFQFERYQWAE